MRSRRWFKRTVAAMVTVPAVLVGFPVSAALQADQKKVLEEAGKVDDGAYFLSVLKVLAKSDSKQAVEWAMAAKSLAPSSVSREDILAAAGVSETAMANAERAAEMAKRPVSFFSFKRLHGQATLGVTLSRGNSDASAISAGLKINRKQGRFEYGLDLNYDRQSTDGSRSTNRFDGEPEVRFNLNDRVFLFTLARYTADQFDGFEYRVVGSAGGGYKFIDTERTKWSAKAGPGVTFEKVESTADAVDAPPIVDTATGERDPELGETNLSLAAFLENDISYAITGSARVENETDILFDTGVDVRNKTALVLKVTDHWSGQLGYEVRWNSDAPSGTLETDTIARISIGYGF